jgi:hypothetical protein
MKNVTLLDVTRWWCSMCMDAVGCSQLTEALPEYRFQMYTIGNLNPAACLVG